MSRAPSPSLPLSQAALAAALTAALLAAAGCGGTPPPPAGPVRLVDLRPSAAPASGHPPPPAPAFEWRFDGNGAAAVETGPGITGVEVAGGRLHGVTSSDFPVLRLARAPGGDDRDLLHSIEVRLRVSAGTELAVSPLGGPPVPLERFVQLARVAPVPTLTSPIVAAESLRTYTLTPQANVKLGGVSQLVIRPTNAPGAEFEVESVRVVSRREHLAEIPAGTGWQGLAGIYKETLVARAPDVLRYTVRLPERPRLDLALGTLAEGEVAFRVTVAAPGGAGETAVLERSVAEPHRWHDASVDLDGFAGREVEIALGLESAEAGALGLWGAPVVRRRLGAGGGEGPQGAILIVADTLRRDHLEVYGHSRDTAPELARLAGEGVRFDDCLAQATWTKPSMASILTSLYPSTHGAIEIADRLADRAVTLAEVYRQAGHATLGLSSIHYVGRFGNLQQGFEELHEVDSLTQPPLTKSARELVGRLIPWLERHREVPFFVLLHVFDPHDPYRPYPPYDTMWADEADIEEHEDRARRVAAVIADPVLRSMLMPTREQLAAAEVEADAFQRVRRAWYDGSIRAMDAELGELFGFLRDSGLAERTVVAVTSDHGEEFLEHGRTGHGHSVYGELTDVPLILWAPGALPAGRVVAPTVESVDLMPTLLELSGLAAPEGVQGRSLLSLVRDGAGAGRAAGFAEKNRLEEPAGPPPRDLESRAVVRDGWKLIHNPARPDGRPELELFDHSGDPLDAANLVAEHPEVADELLELLSSWQRAVAASRLEGGSAERALASEDLQRLRSLGYLP